MLSQTDPQAIGSHLASEIHAQIDALFVIVSLSIVQIGVPATRIACIYAQRKGTLGRFICALYHGCDRQNRSRAHKNWQGRELWVYPESERHQIGWAYRSVGSQNPRPRLPNQLPR